MPPSGPPDGAYRFDDLRALYVNCTLKRSPEVSNTEGLIDRSRAVLEGHGVATEVVRAVDHDIATGVWPDMREHGWEQDAWPGLYEKVMAADILVLCGPIWVGGTLCQPELRATMARPERNPSHARPAVHRPLPAQVARGAP